MSPDEQTAWFTDLYERTFQPVYAYIRRRVPGEADVPDLVADVFTVAWAKQPMVPEPPGDRPWLLAVARLRLAEHHRGAERQLHLIEKLNDDPTQDADAEFTGPELPQALRTALNHLRPTDLEVVRLIAWDRLSHADAAAVLGCSPNSVAIRWHRTIRRLRRQLRLIEPGASISTNNVADSPATERER